MLPDYANHVLPECESTNDLARKLGEAGAPHGTWVSALRQTRGRGRQGRVWVSPEGNLFLSMVVRPPKEVPVTWVPLLSAVQVVESVAAIDPGVPLRIKWPNDLVIETGGGYEKAGGILCEGIGSASGAFVVVGLGLNCQAAPSVDQPTSALGVPLERVRAEIVARLPNQFDAFDTAVDRYSRHSYLRLGREIEWNDVGGGAPGSGTYLGLGRFGELRVRAGGEEKSLYSEEVRLKLR